MNADPIADMLTRIRNANTAMHDEVSMPSSKQKEALAAIRLFADAAAPALLALADRAE